MERSFDTRWVSLLIATMLASVGLVFAATARADETPADPTTVFSEEFSTPGEFEEPVAAGVNQAFVEAVGGHGGSYGLIPGGAGAVVTGDVSVAGVETLYVFVGGNALGSSGGVNGGNEAGGAGPGAEGGGGGGASDVRTITGPLSLSSRLIVAGGGGGAGGEATDAPFGASGAGADAGNPSIEGGESGGSGANQSAAEGGRSGTEFAAGTGGAGSAPTAGSGGFGQAGGSGNLLGAGGTGGNAASSSGTSGSGGGGGGGYYGGGGGGGGASHTSSPMSNLSGAGGGAGGSLLPFDGTIATDLALEPQVDIEWQIPGTVISGESFGTIVDSTPTFEFSTEDNFEVTFECRIDSTSDADWSVCAGGSEHEYTTPTLTNGVHVIEARTVDAFTSNFDPTPARVEFSVDAPLGKVTHGEVVTAPLTEPFPTFGAPAVVIPPPVIAASIRLGHAKLNRDEGTATIGATVNGAGELALEGKPVKRSAAASAAAGTVLLKIAAKGAAARALAKTGEASVKAVVRFAPLSGAAPAEAKFTLRLHRKSAAQR